MTYNYYDTIKYNLYKVIINKLGVRKMTKLDRERSRKILGYAARHRILDLGRERGLTERGIAIRCDISQSTIHSVLQDESICPGLRTIFKICEGMEITAAEFFNQDFEKYTAEMEKELSKKKKRK